jgi:RNA polymerase sigma-70 factor (ECF subfamily)
VAETHPANPSDAIDRETVDRMYAAIRRLPPANRALVLLYLDGFTYREIADVIGISETNVGVRLSRIKKQLAETVKEPSHVA